MSRGNARFEKWWNQLEPQQRARVLRLVPIGPEQPPVFASRLWHELHGWMRDDIRTIYGTPGLTEELNVPAYFRAQQRLRRGQAIQGVTYFLISPRDRESLPELAGSFAIAFEKLPATNGKAQYWLIPSEDEFDEEVLLALSSAGLSARRSTPHQ